MCLLKSLVEDGEVYLNDGRRLLSHQRYRAEGGDPQQKVLPSDVLLIHPEFLLIVLANRPGFPFLGNDFFRECGDVFSTHIVDNLDLASEALLLKAFASPLDQKSKSVSDDTIEKLTRAFADLRRMHEASSTTLPKQPSESNSSKVHKQLQYPFSAREAVSVVKHLAAYPNDSIADAIENILAFDAMTPSIRELVAGVFQKHGLPVSTRPSSAHKTQKLRIAEIFGSNGRAGPEQSGSPRTDANAPKHGKVDESGNPHVGGNTWAGGTGGSDTAGLGGRGGPYRLDGGHPVHQISDEQKSKVSEESRRRARQMAEEALLHRLKEIEMSSSDYEQYLSFKSKVLAIDKQCQ